MKRITLAGRVVKLDDADWEKVKMLSLYIVDTGGKTPYVRVYKDGKQRYLHRFLTRAPRHREIDHINGDGLDNRRCNLRLASKSQQARNSRPKRKRAKKSSRYKGVSWHNTKTGGCWRAEIELPNRKRVIRYSSTQVGAARFYNQMAADHFGRFAKPNKV